MSKQVTPWSDEMIADVLSEAYGIDITKEGGSYRRAYLESAYRIIRTVEEHLEKEQK